QPLVFRRHLSLAHVLVLGRSRVAGRGRLSNKNNLSGRGLMAHFKIRVGLAACFAGVASLFAVCAASAGSIEVFHADSLAGPLGAMKKSFETKHPGVTVNLTGGTSRQLADRILKGESCDVFAPSLSAIAKELVEKKA